MRELDQTDREILAILQRNARESLKGIAAQTGLARSTVRYRLQRMEAEGVIGGYRVELARDSDRGIAAFLFVRLKTTPALALIELLRGYREVLRCYSLAGDPDLLVELEAEGMDGVNALRDVIARREEVAEVRTSMVLNRDVES